MGIAVARDFMYSGSIDSHDKVIDPARTYRFKHSQKTRLKEILIIGGSGGGRSLCCNPIVEERKHLDFEIMTNKDDKKNL